MLSERQIERLIIYRREIREMLAADSARPYILSEELGSTVGCPPALVRKDLTIIDYRGRPRRGYDPRWLYSSLQRFLGPVETVSVALVGVGNLGTAILRFLSKRADRLPIKAVFDCSPAKIGQTVESCLCRPVDELPAVVRDMGIRAGIIAVPERSAQQIADAMVQSGLQGILNFAPVILRVPPEVVVENIDLSLFLEKLVAMAISHRGRCSQCGKPGGRRVAPCR